MHVPRLRLGGFSSHLRHYMRIYKTIADLGPNGDF